MPRLNPRRVLACRERPLVRRLGLCLSLLIAGAGSSLAFAQPQSRMADPGDDTPGAFQPNVAPRLDVSRAPGPIRIDGALDDEGWVGAARARNFAETYPGDMTRPPVEVDAWVTYDERNVYFGFLVRDDPQAIRRTLTDRDQIWSDDYVGVILDTNGDNAWAYFIAANPIGIQGDTRIVNGGDEDMGFDIVFHSEGRVTDEGYQVEMAVPFRSLRFPEKPVQEWNLNFWITHPRQSRSTYSWAAIDRDDPCWLCQTGRVTGVRDVSPGRSLELLPAVTGSQFGSLADFDAPGAGLDNGRLKAEPSLGIKYSFSSNLTTDVAINPDFSQIEADAAQIDVNTTFALFFPERRPFFQEGSDLFQTPIQTVYTRSINNPIGAAKVTSRFGRTSVAYIGGVDRDSPIILPFEERSSFAQAGESVSNIVRVKQTFGTSSSVGALVTDRRLTENGGGGSTFGLDGNLRLSNHYNLGLQAVASVTDEPDDPELSESVGDGVFDDGRYTEAFDGERYTGYALSARFNRNARHWNYNLGLHSTNPTFRAANGFITQNAFNRAEFWTGYTFYFENSVLERFTPSGLVGYHWNFDGERKDQFAWLNLRVNLKRQTHVGVNMLLKSDEVFRGQDFRNLRRFMVNVNSNFSSPVRLGFWLSVGRSIFRSSEPIMGNNRDFQAWGTIKPHQRLVFQPNFTLSALYDRDTGDEIFRGYIVRVRTNYQFTRRLFLRLVTQYNDFGRRYDIDPLVTYKVNPFTAFYVGSTHDLLDFDGTTTGVYQTSRQFFFKFQYLVRT